MIKTLALAAAAACLAQGAAFAEEPAPRTPAASRFVPSGDLDLTREADAQAMLARLLRASQEVCIEQVQKGSGGVPGVCARETLKKAVADLNAPRVSQVYAALAPGQPSGTRASTRLASSR